MLEDAGITIGVVSGALGQRWFDVTVQGMEAHAGPTPMGLRRDALLPAAALMQRVNAIALAEQPHARGTVGQVQVHPNSRNVIPGRVRFTVDFRHADAQGLARMEAALRAAVAEHSAPGITITVEPVVEYAPTRFDEGLQALISQGAKRAGLSQMALASGAAVDHMPHEIEHVLVGTTQPVLQRDEVGPHVLRSAGDEAQHLRQAAQHLHLRGTAGGWLVLALLAPTAKLLEQRHRAAGRLAHVEVAQPGEAGDLGRRGHADHRVAMVAACLQRGQDRQEMVLQEQHAGDHDVGRLDVGDAARGGGVVPGIFGRRMQREVQAGKLAAQAGPGPLDRAGKVGVHRHDGQPQGHAGHGAPGFSGCSELWRHTGSRQ